MKTIVIIPARYASSRLPGKPLAEIAGVPMIVRVAQGVAAAGFESVVATDDERIMQCCSDWEVACVMTRADHPNGTSRVLEAYEKISAEWGEEYEVVINVQGDEPFVDASQLRLLKSLFVAPCTQIATLVTPFPSDGTIEELSDTNLVKAVVSDDMQALYFSRSVVPFLRGVAACEWPAKHQYFTHIGMYGYRPAELRNLAIMPKRTLEMAESLEQLRWLQAGLKIAVAVTDHRNIGIDTPEDLAKANELWRIRDGKK